MKNPWRMSQLRYVAANMPPSPMGNGVCQAVLSRQWAIYVSWAMWAGIKLPGLVVKAQHRILSGTNRQTYPRHVTRQYPFLPPENNAARNLRLELEVALSMRAMAEGPDLKKFDDAIRKLQSRMERPTMLKSRFVRDANGLHHVRLERFWTATFSPAFRVVKGSVKDFETLWTGDTETEGHYALSIWVQHLKNGWRST